MTFNKPCYFTSPLSMSWSFSSSQITSLYSHKLIPSTNNIVPLSASISQATLLLIQEESCSLLLLLLLVVMVGFLFISPSLMSSSFMYICHNLILVKGWFNIFLCVYIALCVSICIVYTNHTDKLSCTIFSSWGWLWGQKDEPPCLRSYNVYFICLLSNLLFSVRLDHSSTVGRKEASD